MDLAPLLQLHPVIKDLTEKAPQVKGWLEERAKKADTTLFLQLQSLEAMSGIKHCIVGLREYVWITFIMGAMLSNPALKPEDIKQKFIVSGEVAGEILRTIKNIKP